MLDLAALYFAKAERSLAGARSEIEHGRYDNAASRLYFACFQAAIAALLQAGIRPSGGQWTHAFVPSRFEGELIGRRHLYPAELRSILQRAMALRRAADYEPEVVSETQLRRLLRQGILFVEAVEHGRR